MRKAFKKISATIKKNFKTKTVLEIGSNDGVFVKNFKKAMLLLWNLVKIWQESQTKKVIKPMLISGTFIYQKN